MLTLLQLAVQQAPLISLDATGIITYLLGLYLLQHCGTFPRWEVCLTQAGFPLCMQGLRTQITHAALIWVYQDRCLMR